MEKARNHRNRFGITMAAIVGTSVASLALAGVYGAAKKGEETARFDARIHRLVRDDGMEASHITRTYYGYDQTRLTLRVDPQCSLNEVRALYSPKDSLPTDISSYEYDGAGKVTIEFSNRNDLIHLLGQHPCAALLSGKDS